ncbi:MAG: radical SAM protein [Spirochaetaceae bacterium]|jgi:radical SAM protein with 4Fe4S-binding SPASM domain|nr:radical SAM protein [Spirochaetaceae bacterium]
MSGLQGNAARTVSSPGTQNLDLSWIDAFWAQAGNYIFSREEDGVLILPPNRVYRLNSTGADCIRFLKNGGSFGALQENPAKTQKVSPERIAQIDLFFKILSGLYQGDGRADAALERVPFDFDFTKLPILGEIAVTYRCNNSCRFCYAGCSAGTESDARGGSGIANRMGTADLPTEKLKRIIDIFRKDAKIPFFSFTGGEPLLRGDLEELIEYAVKSGLEINLISNGTLASPERAVSLYKAGLRTAQISVEASDEALHDMLIGRKGAFRETIDGIQALIGAGISVQTNTTINKANCDTVHLIPAFLAELGVHRFAMNMYIPAAEGAPESVREELFIGYDEIGEVVEEVRSAAAAVNAVFYWYSPVPMCYYNSIAKGLGNKSCAAVDGLLSVAPNGDILPCSSWDEPVGNLLEKPFGDIWFSERARFFKHKEFAPAQCKTCSSFTACQGACPLYWSACGESLLEAHR